MISYAVEKGDNVYVYNEKNVNIFIKSGKLNGYTSTSVSIKRGNSIYVFNDKGVNTAIKSSN